MSISIVLVFAVLLGPMVGAMIGGLIFLLVRTLTRRSKTPTEPVITQQPPDSEASSECQIKSTLSEALKEQRIRCNMTQEFVAEQLGVSRQAVSKWENGTSDPSTSNLIALSQLYGISAGELLKDVRK